MGFTSSEIAVGDILHLKTGASYIGNETLICVNQLKSHFPQYGTILVETDEAYFANTVSVNDTLIVPGGFPNSLKKVRQHLDSLFLKQKIRPELIKIVELNMSEFEKMDGGLTCLSLLWLCHLPNCRVTPNQGIPINPPSMPPPIGRTKLKSAAKFSGAHRIPNDIIPAPPEF